MSNIAVQNPSMRFLCRITARVDPVVSLGDTACGERRYVPIIGGTVSGEEFSGKVVAGGVDWQLQRSDGTLEIAAHYVIEDAEGARVEVSSDGFRHGPPEVMRRLAAGEPVAPEEYYFRTAIRFRTGAARWRHLNSVIAVGMGARTTGAAIIDVHVVL